MTKAVPRLPPALETLAPEQAELVNRHLRTVLKSRSFAGSKRTQDFLRLIVTHALDGDLDSLRERMIGVELFDRPIDYDTGSDAVVRVRASEVRKKLATYYKDESSDTHPYVRIELPSGSYVPKFHFTPDSGHTSHNHAEINPQQSSDSLHSETLPGHEALSPAQHPAIADLPEHPSANLISKTAVSPREPYKWWIPAAAVLVAVLLAAGYFGYRYWIADRTVLSGIHSIAILPLENLSGDPAQEYFADGITEELINELGQVSTLRVISLTSSMSYKGTKKTLPEIARELSVEGVVEGGEMRDGNQVRVSVQLIDALSDRPIWAQTYVRDLTSATAWQGEVAQDIAEEIRIKVTPQEQARLSRSQPSDPAAQDLYLHAVLLRNNGNCPGAIDDLNKAIAHYPGYAQAHSALASCYGMMGETGHMEYQEAFSHQKAEALKAISLDDSLSEAHAELANTAMTLDWNWPAAEAQFQRALALNPNSATSHQKYAFYLIRTGHTQEALSEMERGVDLDPVAGSSFHAKGFIEYFARQYDQALEVTRMGHGLGINLDDWNFLLGDIYAEKGMYRESIAAFQHAEEGPYTLGHLGNAYARNQQPDQARLQIARLQQYVQTQNIGRYEIALVYVGLGDKSKAFEWLEDAYRAHDVGLVYLKIDPCLDPLRSDPRFSSLLQRIRLA